jgi:hypothetical protein
VPWWPCVLIYLLLAEAVALPGQIRQMRRG